MKLGIIESGKLKNRKLILFPREGLPDNIYLVDKGTFLNGSPMFAKFCLTEGCETEVAEKCQKCNK